MKQYSSVWFVLLLSLLVVGCQGETESTSENDKAGKEDPFAILEPDSVNTDRVFVYNCADSVQFTSYVTPDSTWLFLADTTVKTLPVRSASGARYKSGKYLYWSKGNEALLQQSKGSLMTCQSLPQEKPWVAAKLRGINFRALGQEPGWIVEITHNRQTQYVGNYGADTLHFDTPEPKKSKSGETTYQMQDNNNSLKVTISDSSCTDVMSGFKHPQVVSITVNGTSTYTGCGRYLN